jgi:eukaryotic-like serine/threonine-protein kinase
MGARYRITEPLGRGTRVFRGVAESTDGRTRDVAITRVAGSLPNNQKFAAMIVNDVRAAASLHHENVVDLVDIAKTPEGAYFVVTEYVDGCSLETFISRTKRVALPHVLHILVECCKGLAYAHSLDVIHRDVSPRALLLGTKGEVKLVDFGLAKANVQIESSDPGILKGKFSYLAPEAVSGLEVDHRADVFAVGIVLWELLAARRLFVGQSDYHTVELVRAARIPPIEDLDPSLDAIVRKALARDVEARFQSAADLGDALARYAASRDIKLVPSEFAKVVRDVKFEVDYERSAKAVDTDAFARAEASVGRLISLLDSDLGKPKPWN